MSFFGIKKAVFTSLLFVYFLLYLSFISIDFFCPSLSAFSSPLKFLCTLLACLITLAGKNTLLKHAMCITLFCDFLLLFTSFYTPGILLFSLVHYCYIRYQKQSVPLSCFVPLPMLSAAVFYACFLVCDLSTACKYALQNPTKKNCLFAIALGSFFICDLLTAASHLTALPLFASCIWIFYAPVQLFIALLSHSAAKQ